MTSLKLLTLDLGNTNASLCVVKLRPADAPKTSRAKRENRSPWQVSSCEPLAEGRAADIADWWPKSKDMPADLDAAAVSAVGGEEVEVAAVGRLMATVERVLARPPSGLQMAIESPETCGSDRQYAMRAALEEDRVHRALVTDAGTALTVDAGAWKDGEPTFLGGSIALGLGSTAAALHGRGARLPAFDLDVDAPALGRSTLESLCSGVVVGFRGAVREISCGVKYEAFGDDKHPSLFLTGGAHEFAIEPLADEFEGGVTVDPRLVHHGLALAAADSLEAASQT